VESFNWALFIAVGVGALLSSSIYEHFATRNAVDPVKIFKA
jgi:hypothetical protein